MANKHSAAIRTYLNNTYGKTLSENKDGINYEIKYTGEYFMRGIPQKDGTIVYAIFEQSMADDDIKSDMGRLTYYELPSSLTEDEAKDIVGAISLDEHNIVK